MLYVPSRNRAGFIQLYAPDPASGSTVRYTHGAPEAQRMANLSAGVPTGPQMPQGLPLFKPPYSRITAIDLHTGEHAWMVPTGSGDRLRRHPRLRDLNLPPLGGDNANNGPLLTKTLLIYCLTAGGTNNGPRLVAYDKDTGDELASVDLPAGAIGTPLTYLVDGRQYIALTVGRGPRLVAFALPR
jgi:quinoprotein glucose dehydrogenase